MKVTATTMANGQATELNLTQAEQDDLARIFDLGVNVAPNTHQTIRVVITTPGYEEGVRPMADEVELKVGDTVYWDDREGWKGKVTKIHDHEMIEVEFENGEKNDRIPRRVFTKEVS